MRTGLILSLGSLFLVALFLDGGEMGASMLVIPLAAFGAGWLTSSIGLARLKRFGGRLLVALDIAFGLLIPWA